MQWDAWDGPAGRAAMLWLVLGRAFACGLSIWLCIEEKIGGQGRSEPYKQLGCP